MDELLFPDDSRKNESLILYKLIVLYMLNVIKIPLSNSQISDFMLSHELASYFTIEQSIGELLETNLIKEKKVRHTTLFTLTKDGEQTLTYYEQLIPEDVIEKINSFANENKLEIKQQLSIISTYEPTSNKEYTVYCTIKEKGAPIFEININAPDKTIAEKMCDNWQKKHDQLFNYIMKELLK